MTEVFLSTSHRLLVNVESLNAVETVGNISRHRVVPIVIPQKDGYTVKYVPAVSGESIAHGYQSQLVDIAAKDGLPVGVYSSRKEFIKFSEDNYLKDENVNPPKDYDDIRRFEVDVLLKDVVADVGGFLYAGATPVKRTSRLQVGYLLPALEDVTNATAVEAQFHVRYLFSKPQKAEGGGEGARLGQAIYNIEAASALYTMTLNLDVSGIGVPSTTFGTRHGEEKTLETQAKKRRTAAIKALGMLLSQLSFGAKHSRYLPNAELMSCVFTVSNVPFTASHGNFRNYIEATGTRMKKISQILGGSSRIWCIIREDGVKASPDVVAVNSIEDVIASILEYVRSEGLAD
ncbi:MAG: type I-A CRISPR-associated protein Cas7/Csa2 [Nitrososphaerota archaeon]